MEEKMEEKLTPSQKSRIEIQDTAIWTNYLETCLILLEKTINVKQEILDALPIVVEANDIIKQAYSDILALYDKHK